MSPMFIEHIDLIVSSFKKNRHRGVEVAGWIVDKEIRSSIPGIPPPCVIPMIARGLRIFSDVSVPVSG